jgi:hypothetical protein
VLLLVNIPYFIDHNKKGMNSMYLFIPLQKISEAVSTYFGGNSQFFS